jgi:hypothetical protein
VAYFTGALRHAVLDAGIWMPESAAPDGWCTAAMALDDGGKVHFAYYTSSVSPRLRYTTNTSGAWAGTDIATASAGCSGAVRVSLAVDHAGAAHVAFNGAPPDYGLQYATNRGGAWTTTMLDTGYANGVSLAVDAGDKVHIVYSSAGALKYAQDLSGAWVSDVLQDTGSPNHAGLALDAAGEAHISYVDGRNGGELRYLSNTSGSWRAIPVDVADYDSGGVSTDTAIAMDRQGKVHIAYYRGTALRYTTNR